MTTPAIETSGLRKSFGDQVAGVDLKGRIVITTLGLPAPADDWTNRLNS